MVYFLLNYDSAGGPLDDLDGLLASSSQFQPQCLREKDVYNYWGKRWNMQKLDGPTLRWYFDVFCR